MIYNYNYDFDIASLILLFVISVFYFSTRHRKNSQNWVFKVLIISSAINSIFDILGGITIDNRADAVWTYSTNMIYFLSDQVTNLFFFLSVVTDLEMRSKMSTKRKLILSLPIFIMFLVIITNPIHGILFSYNDHIYTSGPFRAVVIWSPLIYFAWMVGYTFMNRSAIHKTERYMLYVIAVINSVARHIQYYNPDILVRCFTVSVSVLLLYIYNAKLDQNFDAQTGLAGRYYLEKEINRLIYNKAIFTSVLIRIVDYDLLEATYGISYIEEYMGQVAESIGTLSKDYPAYQLNSNCYVLNAYENQDVNTLRKRIREILSQTYNVNGLDINCAYYATAVEYPQNFKDYDSYLGILAYFQKMNALHFGFVPFEEFKIGDKARENLVERAIELAISEQSFDVFYQPICTAKEQQYVTAEALVRLKDPKLGMISPAEFIPLAEENGTILDIGNIVLDKVCSFIEEHDLESLGLEYIEVNLSTTQCLQKDFIETIDEITARHNVSANQISFEITETASNYAPTLFTENLKLLRERGYRLALDDFGSGYANIQRLVSSEFDIIKFDKDMTQRTCEDQKLRDLFEKMQNMFHSMGAKIVAEGVETIEQYDFLQSIGCDYIQGYYFSKPLPLQEFADFMKNSSYKKRLQ